MLSPGGYHSAPGSEQEFRCDHNPCPLRTVLHPASGVSVDRLHRVHSRPALPPASGVVSRDWLACYVSTLGKTKYRRLSIPARAALFHVWLLSGGQTPEATFDRGELTDVLALDGWDPAADVIAELVERGWLEVDDRQRVLVHDWDVHQLAATESARRAYERDRKAEWRRPKSAKPDPLPPAPPSPDITGSSQTTATSQRPEMSGTRPGQPAAKVRNDFDESSCPGCGDMLHPGDENVLAGPRGQLWHRTCPPNQAPTLKAVQ